MCVCVCVHVYVHVKERDELLEDWLSSPKKELRSFGRHHWNESITSQGNAFREDINNSRFRACCVHPLDKCMRMHLMLCVLGA